MVGNGVLWKLGIICFSIVVWGVFVVSQMYIGKSVHSFEEWCLLGCYAVWLL
jgi:hypothetical protein